MKKRNISNHMKIFLLWCLFLCTILFGAFGVYQIDEAMKASIITTYTKQQDEAVDRVMRHMKEAYETNNNANKRADAIFSAYIQEEPSASGAYWFLYTQDKVLFERDAMQTAMQEGKNLEALVTGWKQAGGSNLEDISSLFQGKRKHLQFSKDKNGELENVSTTMLQEKETTYIIGCAIGVNAILTLGDYPLRQLSLYIGGGVLGILFLLLCVCLHHQIKQTRTCKLALEQNNEIQQRDRVLLEQELRDCRQQIKADQLMDPLSLFYNREYFYTLLLNMKLQNLKSLGMIVVELDTLHSYIDRYGLEFEQETLSQIRECLDICIVDESVIARVKDNRIVITIISDDYRKMSEECGSLEKALKALRLKLPVKVYSMIQMPNESAMDMYRRVDQIISIQ